MSEAAGWERIDVAGSGGGGAVVLPDLLDVTITSPQENDGLLYDATATQWVNRPNGGMPSGTADGQILTWDDTAKAWDPAAVLVGGVY